MSDISRTVLISVYRDLFGADDSGVTPNLCQVTGQQRTSAIGARNFRVCPVYDSFTKANDLADLSAAKALLQELDEAH